MKSKYFGFLLGMLDFFTFGILFLFLMPMNLQKRIEKILGRKVQSYLLVYLIGIPTLFLYTLIWMAFICKDLEKKAKEMGLRSYTSFSHMLLWNIPGTLILIGPGMATQGFYHTLMEIEEKQKEEE